MRAINFISWNTKLDSDEEDLQNSRRMGDNDLLATCIILSDHNQSQTVDKMVLKLVITKGRNHRHWNSTIPHTVTCRMWQKSPFNRRIKKHSSNPFFTFNFQSSTSIKWTGPFSPAHSAQQAFDCMHLHSLKPAHGKRQAFYSVR
jgi:hypothetical protein